VRGPIRSSWSSWHKTDPCLQTHAQARRFHWAVNYNYNNKYGVHDKTVNNAESNDKYSHKP
jgi:hypothetical protein